MKLLKILTILLFSFFLSVSAAFSQEDKTADTGINNIQTENNSGNVSAGTEMETKVSTEKAEPEKVVVKKNPVNESKGESRKSGTKKNDEKKPAVESSENKDEAVSQVKMDGELLLINEGNFKYKRIPDIKLADIKPEASDSVEKASGVQDSGQDNAPKGFLGLSKTASDIIVKGGVLFLILVIFILYKSRMTHPGSRSSKKRNVLNSYRK